MARYVWMAVCIPCGESVPTSVLLPCRGDCRHEVCPKCLDSCGGCGLSLCVDCRATCPECYGALCASCEFDRGCGCTGGQD